MIKKKVLIADDSRENLLLCGDILDLLPVETISAADGQDALSQAREHLPDLILMDLNMPVMDGLEAAGILRSSDETRHIPIIALSGDGSDVGRSEALDAGCVDFLSKPYDFNTLLAKAKHYLGLQ